MTHICPCDFFPPAFDGCTYTNVSAGWLKAPVQCAAAAVPAAAARADPDAGDMDGECANLMVEKTTMFASDLIVIGHLRAVLHAH